MKKIIYLTFMLLLLTINVCTIEVHAEGQTFSEFTKEKLGIDSFGEEIVPEEANYTTIDEEYYNLDTLDLIQLVLINMVLTMVAYMAIPIIIRIRNDSALDKKKASKVALTNAIVVGSIIAVIEIINSGKWTPAACITYYYINRYVLSYKRKGPE